MGPAFAFLAACAFALGTVLQQKGTLSTTSGSRDSHWLIQILHEPIWLAGLLLQASGWVMQAVALDKGPLMAVQAITTLSLVITLPFGRWLTHQHIDRWVVLGAVAVVAGIAVFLSVGSPHGRTTHPSARTWWIACLVTLVLVLAIAGLGRKRQGAVRALLFGAAAGFGFALQTAVTKDFVTEIGGGVVALLADWSVYVLIASAVTGFVLQQSALKTGVLAPAMASSNAVTLFAGVILGAVVYLGRGRAPASTSWRRGGDAVAWCRLAGRGSFGPGQQNDTGNGQGQPHQVLRNQAVGSTCSVAASGPALVTWTLISRSSALALA